MSDDRENRSAIVEAVGNRWDNTLAELAKYDSSDVAKQTATQHRCTLNAIAEAMHRDVAYSAKLSVIADIFEDCEPGIWAAAKVAAERDGT